MAVIKTIKEAAKETISYIRDRHEGKVRSIRTGFKKLDKCMIDGIELNSTVTIGGRPGVGKSTTSDCIIDSAFTSNLDENGDPDFDLLDFNWEMSARVMLIRRISASLRKTYKYIISAEEEKPDEDFLKQVESVLNDKYSKLPIYFSEEPSTVKEFVDTVKRHVDKTKRRTLIRIDHTLLTRQSASEASQVHMLLNLLMNANVLKKEYPIAFMFLTQLNREMEDRQESRTDKAYPKQGDVYGGDAAAMFSETIALLNRPSMYGISYYGNSNTGFHVSPEDIFMHIVKNRNAEGNMILHYKENFKHMSIQEF